MGGLEAYEPFVGCSTLDELRWLADRLHGQRLLFVNATKVGGGVAEILNRMVPLLGEMGVDVRWDILEGSAPFYAVTKKIHNALHGRPEPITPEMFEFFLEVNRSNAKRLQLDADLFFIHDPQPIALIEARPTAGGQWVWRCHIDLSNAQPNVRQFLGAYMAQYDGLIYSAPAFAEPSRLRQVLIAPSIDPLSEKNKDLTPAEIDAVFRRFGIPRDLPVITQISRFDYLKDPLGVIDAFQVVRRAIHCRLVLAGGPASDDPEGEEVLAKVREHVGRDPAIHVLMLPPDSHVEINALQRGSTVVLQKSLREGFGLTVSEALWKAKPVVASAVGGIPLQIKHRYSGLLVHSVEGTANAIKLLLRNPSYARQLGENGREHVRQNFLLTRHLKEYLLMLLTLGRPEDTITL